MAKNKTLFISAAAYDYHTLVKVAEINGYLGLIGIHDAQGGYLLSFPDEDGRADALIAEYRKRLQDLENNIWMH